jgi:hypothetical protein
MAPPALDAVAGPVFLDAYSGEVAPLITLSDRQRAEAILLAMGHQASRGAEGIEHQVGFRTTVLGDIAVERLYRQLAADRRPTRGQRKVVRTCGLPDLSPFSTIGLWMVTDHTSAILQVIRTAVVDVSWLPMEDRLGWRARPSESLLDVLGLRVTETFEVTNETIATARGSVEFVQRFPSGARCAVVRGHSSLEVRETLQDFDIDFLDCRGDALEFTESDRRTVERSVSQPHNSLLRDIGGVHPETAAAVSVGAGQ